MSIRARERAVIRSVIVFLTKLFNLSRRTRVISKVQKDPGLAAHLAACYERSVAFKHSRACCRFSAGSMSLSRVARGRFQSKNIARIDRLDSPPRPGKRSKRACFSGTRFLRESLPSFGRRASPYTLASKAAEFVDALTEVREGPQGRPRRCRRSSTRVSKDYEEHANRRLREGRTKLATGCSERSRPSSGTSP